MPGREQVSIRDVAQRARVSPTTVSHVLNNSRFVKPETRERVLAAIAELGYQPNWLARSLRRQETRTIGVLVSDVTNPFFTAVVRGIEDVVQAAGYSLILCNSDEDPEKQERYLRVLWSKRVDGLIVAATGGRSPMLTALQQKGVPIVFIDRRPDQVAGPVVGVDNVTAAFQLVDHLIRDGHRRIGIVTGLPHVSTSADRLEGYRRALAAHGLPLDERLIRTGDSRRESGRLCTHALLALPDPPTALFLTNNLMTLGALWALREAGVRCPQEVALIGFDDHDWAAIFAPPLTVVRQPTHQLGVRAAELLLQGLRGEETVPQEIILPAEVVVRASCSERCAAAYRARLEAGTTAAPAGGEGWG